MYKTTVLASANLRVIPTVNLVPQFLPQLIHHRVVTILSLAVEPENFPSQLKTFQHHQSLRLTTLTCSSPSPESPRASRPLVPTLTVNLDTRRPVLLPTSMSPLRPGQQPPHLTQMSEKTTLVLMWRTRSRVLEQPPSSFSYKALDTSLSIFIIRSLF